MMKFFALTISIFLTFWAFLNKSDISSEQTHLNLSDSLIYPQEKHFKHIRQLTFGGNNAEAYFSFDGQKITFQSDYEKWGLSCDQIFYFPLKQGDMKDKKPQKISTGKGRTTCSYFLAGNRSLVYASTHLGSAECPPVPERVPGSYVWAIYQDYDIFKADLKGNITQRLTDTPGYDAEATLSPKGDKIVFTSMRSGDLELWTMNPDGSNPKQITNELGYDGGAFFSPDGKQLVFRASRPQGDESVQKYKSLLAKGLVEPTNLEIFVCNTDGSNLRQVTNLGKANWAPFFHPSGKKIIFSSNHKSERGFPFNLFMIDVDGNNLEQITFDTAFDSFPMFSPDGKKLVFSSNRHNGGTRDTNVFLADWVD